MNIDEKIQTLGDLCDIDSMSSVQDLIRACYHLATEMSGDNVSVICYNKDGFIKNHEQIELDSLTTEMSEAFNGAGFVSIIGNSIAPEPTYYMSAILGVATSVDIYPLMDGTVRMDFCFFEEG